MWVLAFLGASTEYIFFFNFGIMPLAGVWGMFWVKHRGARIGLLVTSAWWILLSHAVEGEGEGDYIFLLLMLLPLLIWGIVATRANVRK